CAEMPAEAPVPPPAKAAGPSTSGPKGKADAAPSGDGKRKRIPVPARSVRHLSLGVGNNAALVARVVLSRPWWRMAKKPKAGTRTTGEEWSMRWQETIQGINYSLLGAHSQQVVGHLPNNSAICGKLNLFRNIYEYLSSKGEDPYQFLPVTYCVSEPHEMERFKAHHAYISGKTVPSKLLSKRAAQHAPRPKEGEECRNMWILKPIGLNRGRGISVIRGPQECKSLIEAARDDKRLRKGSLKQWIVQRYIENPLLIDGRKFDIRAYVLIKGDGDCFIYHDAYLRLSSVPYTVASTEQDVHLTNNAVQKHT
ncbi:tubulin-tyrosine ligase/Tubulin polyglutamylase, partial [Kipferlia bialata]